MWMLCDAISPQERTSTPLLDEPLNHAPREHLNTCSNVHATLHCRVGRSDVFAALWYLKGTVRLAPTRREPVAAWAFSHTK